MLSQGSEGARPSRGDLRPRGSVGPADGAVPIEAATTVGEGDHRASW